MSFGFSEVNRKPIPNSSMRSATAASSLCCGSSTVGTPYQIASLTLFIPQWVKNTSARRSTDNWSTRSST